MVKCLILTSQLFGFDRIKFCVRNISRVHYFEVHEWSEIKNSHLMHSITFISIIRTDEEQGKILF